jgi:DNA-binding transcriptional regulator YiaG
MNAKRTYSINKLPANTTDWKHLSNLSDVEIDARAKADPDATPLSINQLKNFKRVHPPREINIKVIREQLKLTQEAFAAFFGISKRTVQEWEQGRRHPAGAAKTLLTIISHEPEAVQRALLDSHH